MTTEDAASTVSRRQKAGAALRDEIRKFVARFLFLWVVFGLFALVRTVVLAEAHIASGGQTLAVINALIMAKVLLIAEDLHFADRIKSGPLIYPILWKSFAFSLLFIVVHMIEKIIEGLLHHKTVLESLPNLPALNVTASIAAAMFITLVPYFAFHEIGRVVGKDRLKSLLLKGA